MFRRLHLLIVPALVLIGSSAVLPVYADGVSQGYPTRQTNLTAGSLVGIADKTNEAESANSTKAYQLLGIVASAPLISLSTGTQQVQVTISGRSEALVSTINGSIKAGDRIAASPISGVGMKATEPGQVVGIAQADLADKQTTTQTVTDKSGGKQTIKIGRVSLQVGVTYYSGNEQGGLTAILPPVIVKAASSVGGSQVSPLRIFTSLLILIAGFVVVGVMLYSGVRSGMISLGRNPLARQQLRRQLLEIVATALGILLTTIAATYIILKI